MTLKYAPLWLFFIAFAARWLVIALTGFDGLYGQDAFHYFDCARRVVDAWLDALRPGSCYWPLGYPVLEALFMGLTGFAPRAAQLASTVTGAAIAPLVYWTVLESRVGHRDGQADARIPIAAGVTAALCGQLLQSSIVIMSDAPALFWATLSAGTLLRWERHPGSERRRSLWLVGSAAALAIASVTRWIYAGLLLPFGVFVVAALCSKSAALSSERPGSAVKRGGALFATVFFPLLLAAGTFSLIFLPQLYLNQHSASPALSHGWVVGWSPLNAMRTSFDNPDGHFDYRVPPALFYAAPFFYPYYLSPLLTVFVLLGAWQLRHSAALLLFGGWILTLYLYLIGIPYENLRFSLAFFPPIAILAAVGLFRSPGVATLARNDSRIIWSLFVVALCIAVPFTYRGLSKFLAAKTREVSAMRYLQAHVPPQAVVVTFGLSHTLKFYTNADVVDLFAQTPATLRPIVCGVRAVYFYVEKGNIESQWPGKSPATNFQWLRDEVGLQQIGSEQTWVLYRVRHCGP